MSREEKQQTQQAELQKNLWNIANTLRGNMDANEFKDYILGLIFYRYLSENLVNYVEGTLLKDDKISYKEAWSKDEYRYKLYNFKNYLGSTDGYTFFNDYYVQQMEALDIKYDSIINNVSLVPVNTSKWQNILHSLKNVFSLKGEKRYNVN